MEADELVLNPISDVIAPMGDDPAGTITVHAPVKGRGLLIHAITAASDPALFEALRAIVRSAGEAELAADPATLEGLHRVGLLLRPEEVCEWPRCRVALDPPESLLAHAARLARSEASSPGDGAGLVVAPSWLFQRAFELRAGIEWPREFSQEGRLDCFAGGPAFWVDHPAAGVPTPFWLDEEDAERVSALVPGEAPPELPPRLARGLVAAGALVERGRPEREAEERRARIGALREAVGKEGAAVLPGLLHPHEIAALRAYLRALFAEGLLSWGDDPVENRYVAHNEPVSRILHARLLPLMEAVVARPLRPSYSFVSCYQGGARLLRHVDRPQSIYSISMQVDYQPDPAGPTGWRLGFVTTSGREELANMALGDAAVYRGVDIPHFREGALPEGHSSSQLIFEYVPRDFGGPLD